jgi:predicted RNase H-like HicB family nuclease
MAHYIAIIEDTGAETAAGVWFPDLPGCFSAGDTIDQAMRNAPEALELYAAALTGQEKSLPPPRSLMELKNDPEVAANIDANIVALIELRAPAHAAE